jgi:hypothetical protein
MVSSGVSGSLPEGIDSWAKSSVTSTRSVFSGAVCPKVWRRSTALWSTSPVLATERLSTEDHDKLQVGDMFRYV